VISPLRTQEMVVEALAMFGRGKNDEAVEAAIAAIRKDDAVAIAILLELNSRGLREAVVSEYRRQFDSTPLLKDALVVAKSAQQLSPEARTWPEERLTPEALQGMTPEALLSLPRIVLASLPPATIASLPPVRNSIGINLKLLPPGSYTMGRVSGGDEEPYRATLTRPFFLSVHEVTNAQWKRVMGSTPSTWNDDNRPVEQVSWQDAMEFCQKLSALPEEKAAGRVYRLPTEAEWEYACRAGTTTRFSFGDDLSAAGDFGWFDFNAGSQTHPVGEKKPNGFGLYDMHGNVWEWCSDMYGPYPKGEASDPQGAFEGSARVIRGGCWLFSAARGRSAGRLWADPSIRRHNLGLRLALSPSGAEPPESGQ